MSAMQKQFIVGGMADEKLQQMLTLYKAPATIRDMKQVFFYIDAIANSTEIEPLDLMYNVQIGPSSQVSGNSYYAPIGTTRKFNIMDKINDLLDIRVPKDKYVIEISLSECVIEANPSSWESLPDKVVRGYPSAGGDAWGIFPTYNIKNVLVNDATAPFQTISQFTSQATKTTEPQTLYVKIKELDNGEPYNWSVTNSGSYSIDKSHQLLVRHGDISNTTLTLEFGHLVFDGVDETAKTELLDISKNSAPYNNQNIFRTGTFRNDPPLSDKRTYRQARYLDYNREYFNTITATRIPQDTWFDRTVANFYKGTEGIDYTQALVGQAYTNATAYSNQSNYKLIPGYNITDPEHRPPYFDSQLDMPNDQQPTTPAPINPIKACIQGRPLLYNQQASKIGFRFMIKIISMF